MKFKNPLTSKQELNAYFTGIMNEIDEGFRKLNED